MFTSLGACRRLERSVGNVRASAGALAPLVGLLLRVVNLDVSWIDGRPKVDGSQGLSGASRLADHRGGGRRLPVALLLAFPLVLGLALTRGLLLSFGVVLVPQTVALATRFHTQVNPKSATVWYRGVFDTLINNIWGFNCLQKSDNALFPVE